MYVRSFQEQGESYQKVTIMPRCREYCALYLKLRTTSSRVVWFFSELKKGYIDAPRIHASSRTNVLKETTTGIEAANMNM